jgi:hypothetical protein
MLAAMPSGADQVLREREGAIAERPLPLLIQAIFESERTVALELKLRNLLSGEIHRARGEHAEAEEAYRRASRANPQDRRAQELALEMMRARKGARG